MSASLNKILITLVLVNLAISMTLDFYYQPTTYNYGQTENLYTYSEGIESYQREMGGSVNPESYTEETGFGSALSTGGWIVKTAIRGMSPLPFDSTMFTGTVEVGFYTLIHFISIAMGFN